MRGIIQQIDRLAARFEAALIAAATFGMVALVFLDVLQRFFPMLSLAPLGAQTFALALMTWASFLGASLASRQGAHIVLASLSKERWIFGILTAALCAFLCLLSLLQLWGEMRDWFGGEGVGEFDSLAIPTWLVTLCLPYGFGMMAMRFLRRSRGLPLFAVMGFASLACYLLGTSDFTTLDSFTFWIRKIREVGNKEVLLAIPFFMLAGDIMRQGSLAKQLIQVARASLGWLPGGLAVSAVMACVLFASVSGSSPATLIAIGSIMVPALKDARYPENFSIGLLTSAGSLGILIPPSIPMVIYALMVQGVSPIDPTQLFIAGVIPGLLIASLLALYAGYTGAKLALGREPFSLRALVVACREGVWALFLPVVVLGGIYAGLFTPTEGAVVGVVYALLVELLVMRELKIQALNDIAVRSMVTMGALFTIMALAMTLNQYFVMAQIPDQLVAWIQSLHLSPTGFLIAVNLFLLLVGALMDVISAILILAPTLAPLAAAMGIDPIHMGIIVIVNLEIGYLTPPVGLNLFVASSLFGKDLGQVALAVLPTLLILLVGLVLVTWLPQLSTALVSLSR